MTLSARLSDLLNTCVEEYIKSGAPVVSKVLEQKPDNSFSSATIRNDLKTLETMGFLRQMHTSGGRYPTTEGYKSYIETNPAVTFVGDLVNDLYALTQLGERIERKLFGVGLASIKSNLQEQNAHRQDIFRLLKTPALDISAYYLLIKEKMNERK